MDFKKATLEDLDSIIVILKEYKKSICEEPLTHEQLSALETAIADETILFFLAGLDGDTIGICSATIGFSTFRCARMGVFEDFYITPDYEKIDVAQKLAHYVFQEMEEMDITSLWVGCADIDVQKYQNLGFNIGLGNLLTWSPESVKM